MSKVFRVFLVGVMIGVFLSPLVSMSFASNWSTPQPMEDRGWPSMPKASVVFSQGRTWFIWMTEGDGNNTLRIRIYNYDETIYRDMTYEMPCAVADQNANVDATADSEGKVWMVYYIGSYRIAYRAFYPDGSEYIYETEIIDPTVYPKGTIAADNEDKIWIFYARYRDGRYLILNNDGTVFQSSTSVPFPYGDYYEWGDALFEPSLGKVWDIREEYCGNTPLHYFIFNLDGSFDSAGELTPGYWRGPGQVAYNPVNNTIWVLSKKESGGCNWNPADVYYEVLNPDGSHYTDATPLSGEGDSYYEGPGCAAVDRDGRVWLFWYSKPNSGGISEIKYKVFNADGTLYQDLDKIDFDTTVYGRPYCAFDETNKGWLFFPTYPDAHYITLLPPTIPATIDIDPDTLNLESKGNWITCYLELPEDYSVEEISLATVILECSDYTAYMAEGSPSQIGDYDEDGTPDLMVKFDRQDLADYLEENLDSFPQDVTLTVTGMIDSLTFTGEDTIRVILPGKGKTKAAGSEETELETEPFPQDTELYQNYPNPFNPETTIEYDLNKDAQVTLKIYNLSGQLIKLLVNENQSEGHYTITWYGDNEQGEEVASGVYFYQLLAGDKVLMKKMVVLK